MMLQALQAKPAYLGLLETLIRSRFEVDPKTGGVIGDRHLGGGGNAANAPTPTTGGGALLDTTQAIVEEYKELNEPCTPAIMAERLLANAVGASETTGSSLLATMIAIATVPGLMDR